MRTTIVLAVLPALAACSSGGEERSGEPIACAVGRAGPLDETCVVERVGTGKAAQLVVHHPDGGFRRLVVGTDGEGFMSADGADAATSTSAQGAIEVTIGQDRYRIPSSLQEPADDR